MAITSKIDIAVDSAEFLALKAAFDKYESALKRLPVAWQNVGRASSVAKTNFESAAANMAVIGSSLAVITTNSKEFFQVTTATARQWKTLALHTASVATGIAAATESLLKWTGIVSLVTGGAGLFGFDRLAHSVASQRMAAMGTGGERGARLAFTTNFRRLGDPEGILGRVAEAQTNIKESLLLRNLGLTEQDLKGDPTDAAIKALRGASRRIQQDKITGLPVGSDPLLKLLDPAQRRILRDHPEELEEMIAQMRADQKSGRLNLSQADQKGYQDFTTRMETAGKEIETIFVKGLVKLAGPLGELSDATVKLVDKFTDKALPAFIKDLGGAIDWLAKEVEKKEFVEKVEGLAGSIGSLASSFGSLLGGVAGFARWLGIGGTGISSSFAAGVSGVSSLTGSGRETSLAGRGGGVTRGRGRFGHPGHAGHGGGGADSGVTAHHRGSAQANLAPTMAAMEDQLRKEGVPEANVHAAAALMAGQALSESPLNPDELHDFDKYGHPTGYGIYGARLERRTRMLAWLAAHGYAKNSLQGQARQMVHSAMTDSAYAPTRRELMRATEGNIGSATRVITPNFEGPTVDNSGARIPNVRSALQIHAAPGGNTSLSSGAAAAGSP